MVERCHQLPTEADKFASLSAFLTRKAKHIYWVTIHPATLGTFKGLGAPSRMV